MENFTDYELLGGLRKLLSPEVPAWTSFSIIMIL
jgi:hypothetical protein